MKHRWRMDLNWLCGVSAPQWLELLRTNRIDATYLHRAALISGLSVYNTAAALLERPYAPTPIREPLFVLGHWRSGTTLLFDLLAQDPARHAPTAFQVVNPRAFRATEVLSTRLFGFLVPDKRLQDDLPLSFHTPEEDEYALALLSGCSPYLGRAFPDRLAHYERFLTFDDATPDELSRAGKALTELYGRLTAASGRALVLKSPPHTARVRHLLRWFPDARFVHVHRDPYTVFQSTRHLYDTVDWFWALQRRPENVDETILRQYRVLHDAWFRDVRLVPEGRLHELAYEDLARDPIAALEGVYRGLGLEGFDATRPRAEAWLEGLGDYRTNRYPPLSDADAARVTAVAERALDAWGYARR